MYGLSCVKPSRMGVTAFHVLMTIGMMLLFPNVVGYSDTRVTELKQGIDGFHDLFREYPNPMFLDNEYNINSIVRAMGFKDPHLFRKARRKVKYDSEHLKPEDKACTSIELSKRSGLRDSSTCPWYTKLNRDENRRPSTIQEAVCRCKACNEGCCKEVIINLPVTRRYRGKYVPTVEPVSVACVCKHMASAKKQKSCDDGKTHKPTYTKKQFRNNKQFNHKNKMRRKMHLRRQKIKKKRKNVTIEKTRQLIWWRYKNCSYYRYCKL